MVRTRFAPSPTGNMHIGNLKAAIYEYLIAKVNGGKFILRIEDTDQSRLVEGSVELIYRTLKMAGLQHDEGPDVGGDYGPYVQSERKGNYLTYAKQLVEAGKAYYCFCTMERLDTLHESDTIDAVKYDRHCLKLSKEEIESNLQAGMPYVIRQLIPDGKSTYKDEVFGEITFDSAELDDQILIKSDGMPTYNFANVIDDHLMHITHVIRGSEYLSSTPKYNYLYEAFGWEIPTYIHLPLLLNDKGEKFSKRRGDASFEDLVDMGFLPEAIVNYVVLLGWSPPDNTEIFSLSELEKIFDIRGLSKSPSMFDMQKLTWLNGEYIKKLPPEKFYEMTEPYIKEAVRKEGVDLRKLAVMVQSRVSFAKDSAAMLDFIDTLPDYDISLYNHKKMKTDRENSLLSLESILPVYEQINMDDWNNDYLYNKMLDVVTEMGIKNGQMLWPVRTALSGKETTPCGASELAEILGKDETIKRTKIGIEKLR